MESKQLQDWVSDQLFALLGEAVVVLLSILSDAAATLSSWSTLYLLCCVAGYSEGAVVSYVVSLARKAGGVDALASVLHSQASLVPSASRPGMSGIWCGLTAERRPAIRRWS